MSVRIEWMDAEHTSAEVFVPGEEWVGQGQHDRPVLTLAANEVVAIEGTPEELRALAIRILAAADALRAHHKVSCSPSN